MNERPGYWGILPANVRYAKIPAMSKILYSEISALQNKKGYCNASNGYFAALYEVKNPAVSKWFKSLEVAGFIRCQYIKQGKRTLERRVYIVSEPISTAETPYFHSGKGGISTAERGYFHSGKENNTSNNNTSNTTLDSVESTVSAKELKKEKVDAIYSFDQFWDDYGKKNDKKKCQKKYYSLALKDINLIKETLPNYIKATPDVQYRKNPYTYLNAETWNDEGYKTKKGSGFKLGEYRPNYGETKYSPSPYPYVEAGEDFRPAPKPDKRTGRTLSLSEALSAMKPKKSV